MYIQIHRICDIYFDNQDWWTPLMEASRRGDTDIVKLLLQRGANPNAANHVS